MCLGIPCKVISIEEGEGLDALRMGTVSMGGIRKQACLAYVPDVQVGDYVIVHVGFAISRLDPAEAEETLALIQDLSAQIAGSAKDLLPHAS